MPGTKGRHAVTVAIVVAVAFVTGAPAFGWIVNDPARNATQAAYELVVSDGSASGNDKVLFDSGPVKSSQQAYVHAPGLRLAPDHRYQWTVRTQDVTGPFGPYSVDAHFDTGLADGDWHASWIRRAGAVPTVTQVARTDVPADDFALIRRGGSLQLVSERAVLRDHRRHRSPARRHRQRLRVRDALVDG